MKKKLVALVSLACASILCLGIGIGLVANGNEIKSTAYAEGVTTTWSNGGKTYVFEGDTATHVAKDIRDLGMHDLLNTNEGVTGHNANPYQNTYAKNQVMVGAENAAWIGETGGVKFKFKTNSYWYSPHAKDSVGGQDYPAMDTNCYINIYYGDLRIRIEFANWGKGNSRNVIARIFQDCGSTDDSAHGASARYISTFFANKADDAAPNGQLAYMADFATLEISKYKCLSIDGDASAALGYWFKLSLNGQVLYNKYIPKAMTTSSLNDFGISNATAGRVGQEGAKIIDEKWIGHSNLLTVKSTYADDAATATVENETYKDVADMADVNKTLSDKLAYGFGEGSYGRFYAANNFYPSGTPNSVGIEFRSVQRYDKMINSTHSPELAFMGMYAGSTYIYLNYSRAYKKISIWAYNCLKGGDLAPVTTYNWDYDLAAEYAWRITRTNVNFADSSKAGKGAIIKLYMGKINPATDMPEEGWDDAPIYQVYDAYDRVGKVDRRGLGFAAYTIQDGHSLAHNMYWSSNKYVGVKTTVNGETVVNRVPLGGSFELQDLSESNLLHIGWSKGAAQYEEGDFVANGTVLSNLHESATFNALTMKLSADKKASIRFRQRFVDGAYLPLEISLKWNVKAEDLGNVGYYFGGIKFGYKLTADNGATVEKDVKNISDGVYNPYEYSIIQSNIQEASYARKFTCQAYVELNGVKYYTEEVSMDEFGRSVDFVADRAAADLRAEAVTENGVSYSNKIVNTEGAVIGYHYLTQEQYDLVAKASAVISE